MYQIELKNVRKDFTTKKLGTITAVKDFNLKIKKGECFSFLGPSGCGKTTTLRMIAGFEDLTEGEIKLGGKIVSSSEKGLYVPPEERNLGMVFQAFAVWPHMTVFDNIAFPLQVRKMNKSEIKKRVRVAMEQTDLLGREEVYPSELSGGEQQRIALARAIVMNPDALLLDEPLSNLDPKLRESMRFEIKRLQKEYGFTIIFVTHDQSEALALSDRMLVMDTGEIVQVDTPEALYHHPKSRFVHNFLGDSNFTEVEIKEGVAYVAGDDQKLPLAVPKKNVQKAILATRPSEIEINAESGYETTVRKRAISPEAIMYEFEIAGQIIRVESAHHNLYEEGEKCYLKFPHIAWYDENNEILT